MLTQTNIQNMNTSINTHILIIVARFKTAKGLVKTNWPISWLSIKFIHTLNINHSPLIITHILISPEVVPMKRTFL